MATSPIALLNDQLITTISSNADHNSDEQPSSKPALKTQDSLQNTRNFVRKAIAVVGYSVNPCTVRRPFRLIIRGFSPSSTIRLLKVERQSGPCAIQFSHISSLPPANLVFLRAFAYYFTPEIPHPFAYPQGFSDSEKASRRRKIREE